METGSCPMLWPMDLVDDLVGELAPVLLHRAPAWGEASTDQATSGRGPRTAPDPDRTRPPPPARAREADRPRRDRAEARAPRWRAVRSPRAPDRSSFGGKRQDRAYQWTTSRPRSYSAI